MSSPVFSALVAVPLSFHLAEENIFLKALRWSIIDKNEEGKLFNGQDMRNLIEEILRNWRSGTPDQFFKNQLEIFTAAGVQNYPVNLLNTQWAGADWHINQHIFKSLAYEPDISALLQLTVGNQDTFMDIGANWGYCAAFLALRDGFKGQIHAFEPMPESFRDLSGLINALGLQGRVMCHEVALSNADGSATLSSPWWSGNASLTGSENGITVKTAKLDSLALPPPRFIKIDVEGAEPMVMQGAENTIRAHRPLVVFESQKDKDHANSDLHAPLNLMRDYGYDLYSTRIETKGPDLVLPGQLNYAILKLDILPLGDRFAEDMPMHMNIFAVPREMTMLDITSADAHAYATMQG